MGQSPPVGAGRLGGRISQDNLIEFSECSARTPARAAADHARARRDLRPRKCPALIGGLLSLQQEILPTSSRDCAPRLAQTPSKCRLHRWIIWPGPVVLESRVGRVAGAARPLRIRVRARRATAESPSRGRSSEFEDRHDGAGSRGFRSQLNTQGAQWRPSIDISSSKRIVIKFSYNQNMFPEAQ